MNDVIEFLKQMPKVKKIIGVAGTALSAFCFVGYLVLKTVTFSTLGEERTFGLIKLLLILVFLIALVSVVMAIVFEYLKSRNGNNKTEDKKVNDDKSRDGDMNVINNGTVHKQINIDKNEGNIQM